MSWLSLRGRLTLLYVVVFGVTTVAFNAWMFNHTMDTLQKEFDDALYNYAVDVTSSVEIGPQGNLTFPPLRLDDGKILPFALGKALIQVRHISGEILARIGEFGEFSPPTPDEFIQLPNGETGSFETIDDVRRIPSPQARTYRLISLPLDSGENPQLILQIAVPMTLLEMQFENRFDLLRIGIPIVLIIAILIGYLVSAQALRPLGRVIETAKSIDAGDLRQRLPVPKANDEIRSLALTLNDMLERIEKAFRSQERFVADASHQLMTPLTILKGELELTMKGTRDPGELDTFLQSAHQEIETLSRLVQDMLVLARVDAGVGALKLKEIALDELLLEVLPRCERIATSKSVRLIFDLVGAETEHGVVHGAPDLLENLMMNMIENAIKYSPQGAAVRIALRFSENEVEFSVRDRGPGIPDAEMPYIFERFRRAPGTSKASGFGLGLSIAQKIAHMHATRLNVENMPDGGAMFSLKLKKKMG